MSKARKCKIPISCACLGCLKFSRSAKGNPYKPAFVMKDGKCSFVCDGYKKNPNFWA